MSSQHYQIMGAVGYYQVSNGTIQPTQKMNTCPTLVSQAGTIVGTDTGSTITVSTSSSTIVLTRQNVGTINSNGIVIEWGCFSSGGSFLAGSWGNSN